MGVSSIEWTDRTWNPVSGCSKVSAGCKNCYAERIFPRPYPGRAFTDVRTHPDRLEQPLRWRKSRRVFVNSMSDLFHEDVPDEFIDSVFAVMALSPKHTFQILTKRPGRMREYLSADIELRRRIASEANMFMRSKQWSGIDEATANFLWSRLESASPGEYTNYLCGLPDRAWPLPNVWLGVSVEDQQRADERIPILLQIPAAVRFVSAEPLIGPIRFDLLHYENLTNIDALTGDHGVNLPLKGRGPRIDWIIVGGESGYGARPMYVQWTRAIVQQCKSAGVPVFVKQLGSVVRDRNDRFSSDDPPFDRQEWPPSVLDNCRIDDIGQGWQGEPVLIHLPKKGGNPAEWPADLRVRRFPGINQ